MDKDKALKSAMDYIEKTYGHGSVMQLGKSSNRNIEVIPTGSLGLDIALGVNGYPKGRIIEFFGPESSGKTTLALHAIAECQKKQGKCVFIDAEHAFDPVYAKNLGVNIEDVLLSQPDSGEQALSIAETLITSNAIDLVIIDSVAALVPQAEIDGNMGDSHVGLHARLMSQALRKLTPSIAKTNVTLIFINQIRLKIGTAFGNPETTTGGNALKFYASIRIDIRRSSIIKDKDIIIGNNTKVKVVKNKLSSPFKIVEFDILYGEGISHINEIINLGCFFNVIHKSGSWYSYNGVKVGQGKDNVRQYLQKNKEIGKEIKQKILQKNNDNILSAEAKKKHAEQD